jgi:nucleotide-binding universal stress UspA family protein
MALTAGARASARGGAASSSGRATAAPTPRTHAGPLPPRPSLAAARSRAGARGRSKSKIAAFEEGVSRAIGTHAKNVVVAIDASEVRARLARPAPAAPKLAAATAAHRPPAAAQDSVFAFRWALDNIYRPGDSMHIVHVVPDDLSSPASGSLYYAPPAGTEAEAMLWSQAEEFIAAEFVRPAAAAGVAVRVEMVHEGEHRHVGRAVCAAAERLHAEPLVLATHHRGWIMQSLLGSVSRFCAANCKRPVTLVHPDHSLLED